MRGAPRKSAPRVWSGKVQKKNNWTPSAHYLNTPQPAVVIDRHAPGRGFKHVLSRRSVLKFIDLLPDWEDLSVGLKAILLSAGSDGSDGWHHPGIVAVAAWERDLWRVITSDYFDEHKQLFSRLEIPTEQQDEDYLLKPTERQVVAFQLLHVLLHELGHHHDRMTTRSKSAASRGEDYAERYALAYADVIWDRYLDAFGI